MKHGLTVLELIITVATILIIATIGPLIWRRYAGESHDIRRIGAATEMQYALKNYYLAHGKYPEATAPERITTTSPVVVALTNDFFLVRSHPPVDPDSPVYDILYQSNGKTFEITFCQLDFPQGEWTRGCANTLSPLPL